jgi:tRNA pseudouridine32 synthase/23S rRNA pseudouridine746 synthase
MQIVRPALLSRQGCRPCGSDVSADQHRSTSSFWPSFSRWSGVHAGVLLCATSPEARARLGAAFAGESAPHPTPNGAERAIEKQYLALVDGWPAAEAGIVETPIGRVKYGVRGGLHAACPGGKPCESRWSVVRRNHAGTSLLAVIIRTGELQLLLVVSIALPSELLSRMRPVPR